MRNWKVIFYILGTIPWTFIVSLLAFYFNAEKVLGYFPRYAYPDPKSLSIYEDYSPFINWTIGIWIISFLAWLLLVIVYIALKRNNTKWKLIIVSGIGHSCGILLFLSEITNWYLD